MKNHFLDIPSQTEVLFSCNYKHHYIDKYISRKLKIKLYIISQFFDFCSLPLYRCACVCACAMQLVHGDVRLFSQQILYRLISSFGWCFFQLQSFTSVLFFLLSFHCYTHIYTLRNHVFLPSICSFFSLFNSMCSCSNKISTTNRRFFFVAS